jgi:hypothetical protein
MKSAILAYFRFKRQYPYVVTEVDLTGEPSDVVVYDGTTLVEIEVKISIADLNREIKKRKHTYYKKESSSIPHKFYVAIPTALAEKAKPIVEAMDPRYGILAVDYFSTRRDDLITQDSVTTLKRAQSLHTRTIPTKTLHVIVMRMSSMIASFYLTKQLLVNLTDYMRAQVGEFQKTELNSEETVL